jgi:hypothetical protein
MLFWIVVIGGAGLPLAHEKGRFAPYRMSRQIGLNSDTVAAFIWISSRW